jgi:hypothetical protein
MRGVVWGIVMCCRQSSALEALWKQYPQHQNAPIGIGVNFSGLVNACEVAQHLFADKPSATQEKLR